MTHWNHTHRTYHSHCFCFVVLFSLFLHFSYHILSFLHLFFICHDFLLISLCFASVHNVLVSVISIFLFFFSLLQRATETACTQPQTHSPFWVRNNPRNASRQTKKKHKNLGNSMEKILVMTNSKTINDRPEEWKQKKKDFFFCIWVNCHKFFWA